MALKDSLAQSNLKINLENKNNNEEDLLYLKGIENFYGIDCRINYKTAYECFKKLYKEDETNRKILILLGKLYENGLYVQKSYTKAIELYKKASKKGSGKASYYLAQLAEKKILDKEDQKEEYDDVAFKYYTLSSNQGYSDALGKIGIIFEKGLLNTEINLQKAVENFKKTIEIDENPIGLNGLGNAYYNGIVFKQNFENAVNLYKRAINDGNVDALNNLGVCYEFGKGVEQDYSKALDYYYKGKEKLNVEATTNYAILKIKNGILSNNHKCFAECFKILQSSILMKKKNEEAYFYIGLLYELGIDMFEDGNIIKNPYLAFLNYKKSAEWGNVKAMTKVGIALFNGIEGIFNHNKEASISLLEKASKLGDVEAKVFLDYITNNNYPSNNP